MNSSILVILLLLLFVFGCEPDSGLVDTPIDSGEAPAYFALYTPYPNPFDFQTAIEFAIPVKTFVTLVVENTVGDVIRTLVSKEFPAGIHRVIWDAKNANGEIVNNGLYFITLRTSSFRQTQIAKLDR